MTLLITVFAAIAATLIWYLSATARELKISILCYMFWGASIMWFVDAVFEYMELRAAYFTPELTDIVNDAFLGLSVVGFALFIWLIVVIIKDPKGIIRKSLKNN